MHEVTMLTEELFVTPAWGLKDDYFPPWATSGYAGISAQYQDLVLVSGLGDPIRDYLTDTLFVGDPMGLFHALGIYGYRYSGATSNVYGDHPVQLDSMRNAEIASYNTNRYLTGVSALYEILTGNRSGVDVPSVGPHQEKPVQHVNVHGESSSAITPASEPGYILSPSLGGSLGGVAYQPLEEVECNSAVTLQNGLFSDFTAAGDTRDRMTTTLAHMLERLSIHLPSGVYTQDAQRTEWAITTVSWTHYNNVLMFQYNVHYRRYGFGKLDTGDFAEFDILRSCVLALEVDRDDEYVPEYMTLENGLSVPVNGDYFFRFGLTMSYVISYIRGEFHQVDEFPNVGLRSWLHALINAPLTGYNKTYSWDQPWWVGRGPKSFYTTPQRTTEPSPLYMDERIVPKIQGHMRQLRDIAESQLPELVSTAFFSSVDAMEKHIDFTGTNWLESLVEFKDIMGVLQPTKDLAQFFRQLRKGSIGGTIKGALDTGTNAYLLNSFFVSPTEKSIRTFVDQYDRIVNVLQEDGIWGNKTLYGEFRYALPSDIFKLSECQLEVHSKCCVRFDDSSLMTALLGGNAVGLMPRLANLWDCYPWSFVIDWVTGEGRRLGDIDFQSLMLFLPVNYCVHSIRIRRGWDDTFKGTSPMLTPLSDDCSSTYYLRWVSPRLPVMRVSSRYDWRAPEGLSGKLKLMSCMAYGILS